MEPFWGLCTVPHALSYVLKTFLPFSPSVVLLGIFSDTAKMSLPPRSLPYSSQARADPDFHCIFASACISWHQNKLLLCFSYVSVFWTHFIFLKNHFEHPLHGCPVCLTYSLKMWWMRMYWIYEWRGCNCRVRLKDKEDPYFPPGALLHVWWGERMNCTVCKHVSPWITPAKPCYPSKSEPQAKMAFIYCLPKAPKILPDCVWRYCSPSSARITLLMANVSSKY